MLELLPKKHVNADVFAESNPTADGSGTVIAIWDTGVDPTAAGLQVTPDGKPKILDLIDASGCGDVKMRTKFRLSTDKRTVKTLTGRQLTIPSHWKPADGLVRMGVKLASELFPRALLQRLRTENKDNVWHPCVKKLAADVAGALFDAEELLLDSAEARSPTPSAEKQDKCKQHQNTCSPHARSTSTPQSVGADDEAELMDPSVSLESGYPSRGRWKSLTKKKHDRTDGSDSSLSTSKSQLKSAARLLEDALSTFARNYAAPEMVYDCFVFHDGSKWLACVDTSPYNAGKTLADMPLLTDFSVHRQYACFGEDTQLFFTVKILNEGKLLQIVTNDSGHGTHVAAMAAAYFPPKHSVSCPLQPNLSTPESDTLQRNGVAPGAQIVSIKISDSRLGSMETGISLLRAIRWTVQLKCDVVNYSFGEHCVWPNVGRLSKHLGELVNSYGVVMVSSGGNNGPGLGTVGSPGASVDGLIGVAPLVFPDMMRILYSQPCSTPSDLSNPINSTDPTPKVDTDPFEFPNGSRSSNLAAPSAYTWGSRGPALDGSLGLCVAAPGAANTSVASWQLRPSALLNGSSMSAPLVTGCVALLLSGLRQHWRQRYDISDCRAIRLPPTLIRLAIANTASPVPHLSLLDQGHGLIQVDKAFHYLLSALDSNIGPRLFSPSADPAYNSSFDLTNSSTVQDPACNLFNPVQLVPNIVFGWRVRCTVTGPGCVYRNRGIWIRRGWLPRSTHATRNLLPLLRYKVHVGIDFDKTVPLEFRRLLELHLHTSVSNHTTDASSKKPAWLQIAPLVSVTSLGRDISLVIDPNLFPASSSSIHEPIKPSPVELNGTQNALPVERQKTFQDSCSNSAGSFCWPSSLSSPSTTPVGSAEPQVTLIEFIDSTRPELGPVAQIPITIHNPTPLSALFATETPRMTFSDTFDPLHKVRRWFIEVPSGATAGVLRLARLDDNDATCEFKVIVCMPQPRSGLSTGQQETTWPVISLNRCGSGRARSGARRVADDFDGAVQLAFAIPWEADYLELTIAQHWGLEQPATVIGELYFRGLEPSLSNLSMNASDRYTRLVLRSNFATEDISPTISLTDWVLPLRPSESKILYLGHGQDEILINQRGCYAIRLVYHFTCPFRSSTAYFELPWLQEMLYDSDYLVQLYHLYDWRGRFIGAGDYDLRRPKKRKFPFLLKKGDYKAVLQIYHEQGATLGLAHGKPGDSGQDGVNSAEQFDGLMLSPSTSAASSPILSSPLERMRHQPALVRFHLPWAATADRGSAEARPFVTFEFAAFAFSLGLNAAQPLSALDPIPYERQTAVASRAKSCAGNADEAIAIKRGDSNYCCPCLPTSLGPSESTSLFIGLSNERYPSYAARGSYFSGTISFYNSALLQDVVNYPFRLVMDSDHMGSANSSLPKKDEVGSTASSLSIGFMGLSEEDFLWLAPLSDCIRLCRSGSNHFKQERSPSPNGVDVIKSPESELQLPTGLDLTQLKSDELVADQTLHNSPDQKQGTVVTCSEETVSLENEEADALQTEASHNQMPTNVDLPVDNSVEKPASEVCDPNKMDDRVSEPGPVVDDTGIDRPKSSSKMNADVPPAPSTTPCGSGSLSRQLVWIHEQIVRLDTPCTTECANWSDLVLLQSQRAQLWSRADELIIGHSLACTDAPSSKPLNSADELYTKPGSVDNKNFFHHLLTMRLVPSSATSANEVAQAQSKPQVSPELSITDSNVAARVSQSDPEINRDSFSAQRSPAKQGSTDCISKVTDTPGVKRKMKKDGPVHNYLELQLRLVDILVRYGRLLCERLLLAQFTNDRFRSTVRDTEPASSHNSTPSACLSTVDTSHWTLSHFFSHERAFHAITERNRAAPKLAMPMETQIRTYLRQIYTRLMQLTTKTVVSSVSIGNQVEIGTHALPSWLLASGVRELCVDRTSEPTAADNCVQSGIAKSWSCGSVGGRLLLFLLLYHIVEKRLAHALKLLSQIVYQIEEPPVGAIRGSIASGSTPAMGPLRPITSSQATSLHTAKLGQIWLIWVLERIGWSEIASHMEQLTPILFPEQDYSLMADLHQLNVPVS